MEASKAIQDLEKAYDRVRSLKGYNEDDDFFLDFLKQSGFERLFEEEELIPYIETFVQFDFRDFRSISTPGEYPAFDSFFQWISTISKFLEVSFEIIEPKLKDLSLPYLREKDPFKHEFGKGELIDTKSAIKTILKKSQRRESFEEIFPNETKGIESLRLFYFGCIQPLIEILKEIMKPVYGDESIGGVVVIWRNLDEADEKLKSICLASDEVAQSVVNLYRYYAFWKHSRRESTQFSYEVFNSEWNIPRNKLEKAFILTLEHLKRTSQRKRLVFEYGLLKFDGKTFEPTNLEIIFCETVFAVAPGEKLKWQDVEDAIYPGDADNSESLRKLIQRFNDKLEKAYGLPKVFHSGNNIFRSY